MEDGEATFSRLFVEARQILARLVHRCDHLIKAHTMATIGEVGIGIRIQRTASGKGIALDTGDLYQSRRLDRR